MALKTLHLVTIIIYAQSYYIHRYYSQIFSEFKNAVLSCFNVKNHVLSHYSKYRLMADNHVTAAPLDKDNIWIRLVIALMFFWKT